MERGTKLALIFGMIATLLIGALIGALAGGGVFPKEESMRQEADYYSVKHESLDTNVSVSCGHWRW